MSSRQALAKENERTFEQWYFEETVEIAHQKKQLEHDQLTLLREKEQLSKDKRAFDRMKEMESKRLDQNKRLFDMKWKMLEDELSRFAEEKQRMQQQKAFYDRVRAYEEKQESQPAVRGELFFKGVSTSSALKRRYKDLIRIYHPDNQCGDTETIQEINREYDELSRRFG